MILWRCSLELSSRSCVRWVWERVVSLFGWCQIWIIHQLHRHFLFLHQSDLFLGWLNTHATTRHHHLLLTWLLHWHHLIELVGGHHCSLAAHHHAWVAHHWVLIYLCSSPHVCLVHLRLCTCKLLLLGESTHPNWVCVKLTTLILIVWHVDIDVDVWVHVRLLLSLLLLEEEL